MDLPDDIISIVANYLKHTSYSKMTDSELEKEYDAIVLERNKRYRYNHTTSDYFLIRALRQNPVLFKLHRSEFRNISNYEISRAGYLYISLFKDETRNVVDRVNLCSVADIRPNGIDLRTQYFTYGDLKWVDYNSYESIFETYKIDFLD